jgi:flagellar hook-associated protein 3 FlgL
MAGISQIPSTRISDVFVRRRLLNQLSADQGDLVRLQTQISTGRRFLLPSEDAPAALRAMGIEQLLERKAQVRTNLSTNQSFLDATDSALSHVSGLLTAIRGSALAVSDSTAGSAQRQAAAQEVARALQQLVDTGNQKFRGRYLFAGSRTNVQPFELAAGKVQYYGNEGTLSSYSDTDVLFASNAHGNAVFGAISEPVRGTTALNPVLTYTTRLADLHGGQGINLGSVSISDGTYTSIVDLSTAKTLGDVAALLEANPPGTAEGTPRRVNVSLSSSGLVVDIDSSGSLIINEVGGGTTAVELGILKETAIGTQRIGDDLDRRLRLTTSLDEVLGVQPSAIVVSPVENNDLRIFARQPGTAYNGVTISFIDDPTVLPGEEPPPTYDSLAGTLTFRIDGGSTTANHIVALLADNDLFGAELETGDSESPQTAGTGAIDPAATGTLAGGSGTPLDTTGLRIVNGGQTFDISFATARTIEDVCNLINGSGAAVRAEMNAGGTGIDVRSCLSGADFSIGELGGTTATQLGLRTFTAETRLEDLNHGLGVHTVADDTFQANRVLTLRRTNGTLVRVDLTAAQTIGDVLDAINGHADNGGAVLARLAAVGNGIELLTSEVGASTFAVLKTNGSQAAEDLGLVPVGQSESDPAVAGGGVQTITGRDANPQEVSGAFTALSRLRDALVADDAVGIQRALERLDDAALQLTLSRAELGARQQGLDVLESRLDDEVISLEDSLSREIEADIPEAISNLTARQAAFEASLRTIGTLSRLTLLDFI